MLPELCVFGDHGSVHQERVSATEGSTARILDEFPDRAEAYRSVGLSSNACAGTLREMLYNGMLAMLIS